LNIAEGEEMNEIAMVTIEHLAPASADDLTTAHDTGIDDDLFSGNDIFVPPAPRLCVPQSAGEGAEVSATCKRVNGCHLHLSTEVNLKFNQRNVFAVGKLTCTCG
jgi:hypothetical protein